MQSLVLMATGWVRAIQAEYGKVQGLQMWKKMSEALPIDIREQILQAIMTEDLITIDVIMVGASPVHPITVICKHSDLTHTSVLDMIKTQRETGESFQVSLKYGHSREDFLTEFNKQGCRAR
jgi:hypothetical protein